MMKTLLVSDDYKKQLILEYLIPAFRNPITVEENKTNDLVRLSKLQFAIKYQDLETPGLQESGLIWLSIGAMCHSYFFPGETNYPCGTAIYKRRELIFDGNSLIHGAHRSDYVQIIEPGEVLSFSFHDFSYLMETYDDINFAIRQLADQQSIHFRERNTFRNLPAIDRVKKLKEENEHFMKCATQEIQAMHACMSLKHYGNIIRSLRPKIGNSS